MATVRPRAPEGWTGLGLGPCTQTASVSTHHTVIISKNCVGVPRFDSWSQAVVYVCSVFSLRPRRVRSSTTAVTRVQLTDTH